MTFRVSKVQQLAPDSWRLLPGALSSGGIQVPAYSSPAAPFRFSRPVNGIIGLTQKYKKISRIQDVESDGLGRRDIIVFFKLTF